MLEFIMKLDEYLKQLPKISFNYGKCDINVIKIYFVRYFVDKSEGLNDVKE